ncbi:CBS domain [Halalkaliarchaeum sp. AArc-CO]|uniref:CBS domain-containing protein n=1 Tax=unclassified Halalkaliarchaeum TaxID=2678344 RepID=UPI00217D7238|nr:MULTISPECIES: CBS domain-containing protein [unclassified Halalkaliarchaeum]MDR5671543.1 CBS domain-containing protein [Halalkaliarchaeum sp. AArc-GB]UWG51043.1 CBS domain [Halalkaliarchaeum sp. AArc-CO]
MQDILVGRLMSSPVRTVSPDTLVEDAANVMLDEGIGSVVVADEDNQLCGILTSTDFVQIVAERKPKDQTPVEKYMTTGVLTASAQDPIVEAAETMIENDIHHLPVVSDVDGVIGIVTTTDLAAYVSNLEPATA